MDFLGEVPLHMDIRETSDNGKPIVVSQPESAQAKAFQAIAKRIFDKIYDPQFAIQQEGPKIVFS